MINKLAFIITSQVLLITANVAGQDFNLSMKSYLVSDTNMHRSFIPIRNLIGTEGVAYKLGNDDKVIGVFIFHRDSSLDVKDYNPIYPYGYYLLRKGRYICKDTVMLKDGAFVFMEMKALGDTSSICFYDNGELVRVFTFIGTIEEGS